MVNSMINGQKRHKAKGTMKKKILVWETLATVSGGQKMTLTVMDMLADEYEFCCLIPEKGMLSSELDKRGIPYVLMGDQTLPTGIKGKQVAFQYGWMSVKNIYKSLRVIRKYKPDILYCPGPAALPWSAICGSMTRKPVIWHLHHIFLDGATRKLLNICGKWKSVRRIIAVSNCVGNQITSDSAHQKVEVLYNPVDVQKYVSGNAERVLDEVEQALGRKIVRGGVLILTHIGAITKNKRQDVFVSTIHEIKKRDIEVVGLMIGEAVTEADKEYKKAIDAYILENGLENDIYIPGFRKDIADILAATDCVLVPSDEGLGLVAMEAMSARKHVVGIDTGGVRELFNAARCGTTYPSGSAPAQIAETILKAGNESAQTLEQGYSFCMEQSPSKYREKLYRVFGF